LIKFLLIAYFVIAASSCNTPAQKSEVKGLFGKGSDNDCRHPGVATTATARFLKENARPGRSMILLDNEQAWYARWRAISSAQSTIDIQYFIIENDEYGQSLLGLLLHKLDQGVKVNLMIDLRGTALFSTVYRDYMQELANAGASIKVYNPSTRTRRKWKANFEAAVQGSASVFSEGWYNRGFSEFVTLNTTANHDKIVLVDNKLFITGGRNISKNYFEDPKFDPHVYDDIDIMVRGPGAVGPARKAFEVEFNHHYNSRIPPDVVNLSSKRKELLALWRNMEMRLGKRTGLGLLGKVKPEKRPIKGEGNHFNDIDKFVAGQLASPVETIAVLDNRSAVRGRGCPLGLSHRLPEDVQISVSVLKLVAESKGDVLMFNPYVIFSDEMHQAVAEAAKQNRKVTIITNSPLSTDSFLSQAAFYNEWKGLIDRHPNLRIFGSKGPQKLHGKAFVFGSDQIIIGSFNLDPMSQHINSEIAVHVKSVKKATDLRSYINRFIETKTFEYKKIDGKYLGVEQVGEEFPHYKEAEENVFRFQGVAEFLSKRL